MKTIGEHLAYRQGLLDASELANKVSNEFEAQADFAENDVDEKGFICKALGANAVATALLEKEREFMVDSQSSVAMKPH